MENKSTDQAQDVPGSIVWLLPNPQHFFRFIILFSMIFWFVRGRFYSPAAVPVGNLGAQWGITTLLLRAAL